MTEPTDYLERPIVLTEVEIADVLEQLGATYTKIQGNNVQSSHCMLHGNNSPTLGVSLDAPHAYNCFSCQARGPDIISLVQKAKRMASRHEAYAFLAERFGVGTTSFSLRKRIDTQDPRPRYVIPKTAFSAYPLSQSDDIGYRAAAYYLQCSRAEADAWNLGYHLRGNRLVFPIFHADGQLAGLVGRSMLPGVSKQDRWLNFDAQQFRKGSVLMGAELPVKADTPIIVVEGPHDFFTLRRLGWHNVRATLGTEFSEWQSDALAAYDAPLVPLFDEDRGGDVARKRFDKVLRGRAIIMSYKFPEAARSQDGKADPAMLTPETFAELVGSFRRAFNFARLSRTRATPT